MLEVVDYLRSNRLSVFTEEWTRWTGTPVAAHFTIGSAKACLGRFDEAVFIPSGFKPGSRVSGWAWDLKSSRGPQTVILADEKGQIAGVTRGARARPDVIASVPEVKSVKVGWHGYIAGVEAKPVTAYLLGSDGKSLCSLGTLPTGFPVRESAFSDLMGVVDDVAVATQGAWTKDGYYPDTGHPPVDGAVYASWSGSDANTGTLRLGPFQIVNQLAIAVPVFSGPRNEGLLIKVVNTKTRELIAALSPPPLRNGWWAWRVDLPATSTNLSLEIDAEDMGTSWGEWQAVGVPHFVKGSALSPVASLNQPVQEIPFSDVGAPVEGGAASIEGSWTKGGYYPNVGRPPVEGVVYGSWSGNDANLGKIRLGPFRISGQRAVAIPLITGPKTSGLEVKVTDAATGEILGVLDPPPLRERWWAWRIVLPPDRSENKIFLSAEDNGSGWGQWQALGVPHLVKSQSEFRLVSPAAVKRIAIGKIDSVNGIDYGHKPLPDEQPPFLLPVKAELVLEGWLANRSDGTSFDEIDALANGRYTKAKVLTRQDVAAFFKNPALAGSGFQIRLIEGDLKKGIQRIDLIGIINKEHAEYRLSQAIYAEVR
jgi:hypothetical protein